MKNELTPLQALDEIISTFYDKDSEEIRVVKTALKEYEGAKEHIKALNKERVENSIKLKALEIIKKEIKIEFTDHFFGIKGNYYIIVNNDVLGAIKVDKEEYDLLKEIM